MKKSFENFFKNLNIFYIFRIIYINKLVNIIIVLSLTLMAAIYSYFLPNIYESKVLANVANSTSNSSTVSSLTTQFGGLASMAGINLSNNGSVDKASLIIATMESRIFFERLINQDGIKKSIYAAKSYDPIKKESIYDPKLYDVESDSWNYEPTSFELYDIYFDNIKITQDKETGLIEISYQHTSPYFSKQILDLVISELNSMLREKDLEHTKLSMVYLNEQLSKTSLAGIKNSINELIKSQVESEMIANVKPDYALEVIDPPYIPEKKTSPSRSLITTIGFLYGVILSVIISLLIEFKNFINRNE